MNSVRFGVAAILICGIVVLINQMEVSTWMTEAAALSARQDLMSAQLLELRHLQEGLFDLQNGARAYTPGNNQSALEAYAEGRSAFDQALSRLHSLFRIDSEYLAQVDKLAAEGRAEAAAAAEAIQLRRDGGGSAAPAEAKTPEGLAAEKTFRTDMKDLMGRLDRARAEAIREEVERYRDISTLGLDVNALILLLVVVGIGFLSLSIRRLDELQKQREREAMHDTLTGLPNRRYLHEWLTIALAAAARSQRKLTLLYFDLDGFKGVNDRLGHEAGDRVLQAFAVRLRRLLRSSDFVARLGGDEFVGALPEAPSGPALSALIERLQQELSKAPIPEISDGTVAASIGYASFPDAGADAAELLAAADRAMYEVKMHRKSRALLAFPEALAPA